MSREFAKLLAPLARRIRLTAARAIVTLVNDAAKMQTCQVKLLDGEVRDGVERFQQFGFSGFPMGGVEGIYLSLNGSRDQGVLISIDDRRYRPTDLEAGDSAQYDIRGQRIHLTKDGIVIIGAGLPITIKDTPKVRMETELLECTGEIKDRCDDGGRSMSSMREVYDDHDHDETGSVTDNPNQSMA